MYQSIAQMADPRIQLVDDLDIRQMDDLSRGQKKGGRSESDPFGWW
jgi:hypothetical protein